MATLPDAATDDRKRRNEQREVAFLAVTVALLLAGIAAAVLERSPLADLLWTVDTVLGLVLSAVVTAVATWRRQLKVDVIALLALAGALWVGEPLAGAIISVMLATGRVLEARAAARAERDLSLLISRAPRRARRRRGDDITEIDVTQVARGDLLIVGSGEIVPVDGRLQVDGIFDESALTGESVPVERSAGQDVRSGVVNAGAPVELLATSTAADSTYADIIRMVQQAGADTAPLTRAADRFAIAFVPITVVLAGAAWALSADPVRAVAVLVVATPCPLLLAAPIAIMSGLSRCSRAGVVVKGGGALEQLAAGKVMLFDKTGTLTVGRPTVIDVVTADPSAGVTEIIRLSASLDQVSPHVLATSIVSYARSAGVELEMPAQVEELHGHGLTGSVAGHQVRLGKASWIVGDEAPAWVRQVRRRAAMDGSLTVFVGIDGEPAGAFLLDDPIRPDASRMIRQVRSAGIERIVLVTGDRTEVAEAVARIVGVDAVAAERDPGEKVDIVHQEREHGDTIMVGDGVNDAPALAAATLGVALASRGSSASSQTADIVLTVDRIGALAEAIGIAKRSRRIALQAVVVGMGLSAAAMVAAALGYLPPVYGALLQEVIDVLAILIALRALLPAPHSDHIRLSQSDGALVAQLQAEHAEVRPLVERIRTVADSLSADSADSAQLQRIRDLTDRLEQDLIPHEEAEERLLYPVIAALLGGTDPMAPMSRSHAEITHQVGRLRRLVSDIGDQTPVADDIVEIRRLLYGLYAILRLHNAQEEEGIFSLAEPAPH